MRGFRSVILDGELFGTVVTLDGARPASVYEVYCMLQGEPVRPVQLKYAAFDILYLNGNDLTGLTLGQLRRGSVQRLVIGRRRSRPKLRGVIFGPGGYCRRLYSA